MRMLIGLAIGLVIGLLSGWFGHQKLYSNSNNIAKAGPVWPKSELNAGNPISSSTEVASMKSSSVNHRPKVRNNKFMAADLVKQAMELSLDRDLPNPQRATDLFSEALEMDPNNIEALRFYSNLLVMSHDDESALPLLNRCVKQSPKSTLCWSNLANIYFKKNDLSEIDRVTAQCLKEVPEEVPCLYNRGLYFLTRRDYPNALSTFKLMELKEEGAAVTFNKGVMYDSIAESYEDVKNIEMANDYYNRACKEGYRSACDKLNLRQGPSNS